MKFKLSFLIFVFFVLGTMNAQNGKEESLIDDTKLKDTIMYNDTYSSPLIKDKMTQDQSQNKKWKKGLYKYPAKPKHAWELGLHGGHYLLSGDVDSQKPLAGFGLGIHLRKAVHYAFSVRFSLFYGQTKGVDPQRWSDALVNESVWDPYDGTMGWYPKYKLEVVSGSIEGVFNIGNILFHKERNKWNWVIIAGIGLNSNQTMLDLTKNDLPYDISSILSKGYDSNTKQGRANIIKAINNLYDGEYETAAYPKGEVFRMNDKYHIHGQINLGMGLYRKINKRINIGVEHEIIANDNDYLDGMKYRTSGDQSNNVDMLHYTSVRLAINLINFKKGTEPLYWINPLDFAFNDIAALKQRPVFDLTDSDADGIIDMMDMELDSPGGCPVDTRGVTLDSDGDGLTDCKDKEPYSPPGFEVDEIGVAIIPEDEKSFITKEEVREMFNESFNSSSKPVGVTDTISNKSTSTTDISNENDMISTTHTGYAGGVSDWFLPMIHFDLDKYFLKPQFYGHLKHVADMMGKYPNMRVTAFGATDVRSSKAYNEMLSFNRAKAVIEFLVSHYGIDRSRFNLMYGGEGKPLVPNLPDTHNISKETEIGHYINRRVEFRSCEASDYDMPRPSGVIDAGQNSPNSSRPGSKYSGNKNSGF